MFDFNFSFPVVHIVLQSLKVISVEHKQQFTAAAAALT